MKYTKIPETTFKELQLNAGVICKGFDPKTGEVTGLLGATTGGMQFKAVPTYEDYGSDIDNCPANMMELMKQTDVVATLDGTMLTVNPSTAKSLMASADVDEEDETHIVPRKDLLAEDFDDVWWVGDYSDINDDANGGYIAIHMMNTLNTAGFSLSSTDKGKGQFAFSYKAHFSMETQDVVPYEVYVKAGTK